MVEEHSLEKPLNRKNMIDSTDILTNAVEQRNLEPNLYAIKFGLAANRPTNPGTNSHYHAYFATDTGDLSCWDGSSWLSTTLS